MSGADVLEDEAQRWRYFLNSGCANWFEGIKDYTLRSSFVDLHREEAQRIVDHFRAQQELATAAQAEGQPVDALVSNALLREATAALEPLQRRLETAVQAECAASSVGLAFVKLSTRSPKDSKRALARAQAAYQARLDKVSPDIVRDDNERWKMLSEEVTKAGAVANAAQALERLLDSERVFEDLEYVLVGPKTTLASPDPGAFEMSLVARAWDPRLRLQSEFRGIAWDVKLTCLCQYFHPLFFAELPGLRREIEADCRHIFEQPAVQATVQGLGGHCIIDFAWLGPGEVVIVELNPFDGVCLGTFPGSTGLFLWDNEADRIIMKGEAPFEMRVREAPLPSESLRMQCNPAWRRIIYGTAA